MHGVANILLLRHAISTANEAGRLAGWADGVHLTQAGRRQAELVRDRTSALPLSRVVCSPLERCRETAELAFPPGIPTVVDARVGECHYGDWTDRPLAELAKEPLWRVIQDDPGSARFGADPTGRYAAESLVEMADRMWAALTAHDAEVEEEFGPTAWWALVGHGDPIKSVVARVVGAGVAGLQRVRVDPASITVLHRHAGQNMLVTSNTTSGDLGALAPDRHVGPAGDAPVGGGAA